MSEAAAAEQETGRPPPISELWLTAIVAAGLVAALLTLLVAGNDDDVSLTKRDGGVEEASVPVARTVAATPDQLSALAASAGYPIYGERVRARRTNEVTRLADGRVFIRYLPPNAQVGAASFDYGFVATYPTNAKVFSTVRKSSRTKGTITRELPGGGLAVANRPGREIVRTTSAPLPVRPVFFAYPGDSVLVEVYDPAGFNHAFRKIASGRVTPIS